MANIIVLGAGIGGGGISMYDGYTNGENITINGGTVTATGGDRGAGIGGGSGSVKRLSAAVVLNYQPVADEKGVMANKALSPEQLEQMTALVRETIGFNKDRGDSVNLMNAPFQIDAAAADLPLWKQPETLELARNFAWPVGLSLFAALVVLGLVRPALKAMSQPVPVPGMGGQLDALEADQPQRPALGAPNDGEPTVQQLRLEDARALALANPMAVANIMKNWVNGEAA